MKLWIYFAVFAASSLQLVAAQNRGQCSEDFFKAMIVITSNETYPFSIRQERFDFNYTFFRNVLGFNTQQIQDAENQALEFFARRYGLDFSNIQPNTNNQRRLQNATFFPFKVPIRLTASFNRWLATGDTTSSRCYRAREGGYAIDVDPHTMGQVLHGEYGGTNGSLLTPFDTIAWAYYHIDVCDQNPIIIRLTSNTPARPLLLDPSITESNNLWHEELGSGIEQGIFTAYPIEGTETARLVTRRFMTFPDYL